jgi:hypothetical protein
MTDDSLRFRHLRERAELEDDAALHAYAATLDAAQEAAARAEASEARARGLAAGAAARATIAARAAAAAAATAAARRPVPTQAAPPWEWLPAPPPGASAAALGAGLAAALRASPHYHASNCDTMLGEAGACPGIVAALRREAAAGLAVGQWEAAQARAAEAGDAAAHAAAAAARDAALHAAAGLQAQEQREARAQLAAFRDQEVRHWCWRRAGGRAGGAPLETRTHSPHTPYTPTLTLSHPSAQRESKRRGREREAQWEAQALERARLEAEGAVGTHRVAARAAPSPRAVREALDAQVLEKELLAREELAWHFAADQAALGFSAAARLIG